MYHAAGNTAGNALQSFNVAVVPISYAQTMELPIHGWPASTKRFIDVTIAMFCLLLLFVPMLMIAFAIALDSPGPILFRQQRIGFANVGFTIWKFRTMRHHPPEDAGVIQTTRHDPRVTRIGAILRRWSVDEWPQLYNVLRGDMSIVGPRPHAPGTCAGGKPFELITARYAMRHCVRPGMTGLAQVRGWRGETKTEEKLLRRIESDLEYIENWSLSLDFVIVARTLLSGFAMRNAC